MRTIAPKTICRYASTSVAYARRRIDLTLRPLSVDRAPGRSEKCRQRYCGKHCPEHLGAAWRMRDWSGGRRISMRRKHSAQYRQLGYRAGGSGNPEEDFSELQTHVCRIVGALSVAGNCMSGRKLLAALAPLQ